MSDKFDGLEKREPTEAQRVECFGFVTDWSTTWSEWDASRAVDLDVRLPRIDDANMAKLHAIYRAGNMVNVTIEVLPSKPAPRGGDQ